MMLDNAVQFPGLDLHLLNESVGKVVPILEEYDTDRVVGKAEIIDIKHTKVTFYHKIDPTLSIRAGIRGTIEATGPAPRDFSCFIGNVVVDCFSTVRYPRA